MRDIGNPLFPAGVSRFGVLALFSRLLGAPQPDWPVQTVITGFQFFDQPSAPDPVLEAWLADGPPPVVFTLGSSAVLSPGDFFRESAKAARRIGVRALLLGAPFDSASGLHGPDILRHPYASYAEVFPRAAAVVHQGGVGTTAEALRAGRPMLVVPFGVDQPDNGVRMERLGVGRVLCRKQYRAARVARELQHLLSEPGYVQLAEEAGETIRSENGAANAADAVEGILQSR